MQVTVSNMKNTLDNINNRLYITKEELIEQHRKLAKI